MQFNTKSPKILLKQLKMAICCVENNMYLCVKTVHTFGWLNIPLFTLDNTLI